MKGDAALLTREADQITSPAKFAQSAKLKRKALAKEKEIAKLQAVEVPFCHFPLCMRIVSLLT